MAQKSLTFSKTPQFDYAREKRSKLGWQMVRRISNTKGKKVRKECFVEAYPQIYESKTVMSKLDSW